jgi:hypothetical protein
MVAVFTPKEERDGEWIGHVAVYEEDAPKSGWTGYLQRDSWMTEREAREWAARHGYTFTLAQP